MRSTNIILVKVKLKILSRDNLIEEDKYYCDKKTELHIIYILKIVKDVCFCIEKNIE
jgi:hypothetical protein